MQRTEPKSMIPAAPYLRSRRRPVAIRLTALRPVSILASGGVRVARPDSRMNAPAAPMVPPQIVSLELIRTLVGYDTTSRDSNLGLIHWVRDYLAGHGIASDLTFDDDRRKANLFATLSASDGNFKERGIVLSGHTDVVPVDGQPWDTDPFVATVKDGKLYGRGVTDMKSFSATGLAMVPEFLRRGLKRPVHFALSYDEEVGCIGVRRLLADIGRRGI